MAIDSLTKHVRGIADELSTGNLDPNDYCLDHDDRPSAFDYLQSALDIEWILCSNRQYLGARVLVAFGGPNIWINTRTNTVEGYWWGDQAAESFNDALGLNDALLEIWEAG